MFGIWGHNGAAGGDCQGPGAPTQVPLIHSATGKGPTHTFKKKEAPNRRAGSFHTEEAKRRERTAGGSA